MANVRQTIDPPASGTDHTRKASTWRNVRLLAWLSALLGSLVLFTWALLTGWPAPVIAEDIDQHRLNHAVTPPGAGETIVQSFRSKHDGLEEVELLLARGAQTSEGEAQLTLRLLDEQNNEIASSNWNTHQLRHNQPLTLRFAPQGRSAGRNYRLVVEGSNNNPYGAWAYTLDVYAAGDMQAAHEDQAFAGDLRFTTRYRLLPRAALRHLGDMLATNGLILILGLLLLPLPGFLVLLSTRHRLPALDRGAWWGLAFALGLALWPLLWYWLTLAGGRWTRTSLILILVLGWLMTLSLLFRRRFHAPARPHRHKPKITHPMLHTTLLLILVTVALAVRLLAIRDLAFPPWVDSSRHALITALMAQSGQAPGDYRPLLPVDDFTYHYGFHTLPAGINMLLSASLPETLPGSLLAVGQLLNALSALTVYSAAWLLTRRRDAALLAAFLVALPFFFPAYYLTWGRYTQLSGALLLAPLLALSWLLARGARGWRRAWWVVGLLAAGLFFVHARVFLLYVLFVALACVAAWTRRRPLWHLHGLLGATSLALLLVGPRLWELARSASASGYLVTADQDYASFPTGYVTTGWERWFLLAGGLSWLLLSVMALRGGTRRRRALLGLALGGWAGLIVFWLSGSLQALPSVWLINLNSAYILVFIPLALVLALAFSLIWPRDLRRARARLRGATVVALSLLLGVVISASALFGARQQINILNETTILAREADRGGLAWAAQHLPQDARVAVNSWRWLGATWAAGDGGAWLLPLTGIEPSTPPVDYIGDRALFMEVIDFNEGATAIADWSTADAAEWLAQQGFTHVFVGARGGFLDPAALSRNPGLQQLYGRDGVFVFELRNKGVAR